MGRILKIKTLSADERARIDAVIREHNYNQLDAMVAALSEADIQVSRSALHRYSRDLEKRDGACCQDENITVVVIVSRATGKTETILTPASSDDVAALVRSISSLKTPEAG